MNLRNTLAGLAFTLGTLVPGQAEAETETPPQAAPDTPHAAPSAQHNHPHHLAFGTEVSGHAVLANVLYTHEIVNHWSLGAQVGLGANFHGVPAGSLKVVGTFHKGVAKPFYVVGELGAGAEFTGSHVEPVAEIAGLIGVQVSKNIGFAIGPAMVVTPQTAQPAAIATVAIGF